MIPYVQDPGGWSQVQEELAIEQQEIAQEQYIRRCLWLRSWPALSLYQDKDMGTVYKCSYLPLFWVIDPETGEKVERS